MRPGWSACSAARHSRRPTEPRRRAARNAPGNTGCCRTRKWHKDAARTERGCNAPAALLRDTCGRPAGYHDRGRGHGIRPQRARTPSGSAGRAPDGGQTKKECVQCGKQFTTTLTQKITCGKECARSRADARKKALYDLRFKKEKTCVQCGKAFKPSRARTKICSKECVRLRQNAQVYQSYKRRRKKDLEKTCTECGKAFQTPRAWNVTCGKECARLRQKRLRIQDKDKNPGMKDRPNRQSESGRPSVPEASPTSLSPVMARACSHFSLGIR